jgi:hypothetical protein
MTAPEDPYARFPAHYPVPYGQAGYALPPFAGPPPYGMAPMAPVDGSGWAYGGTGKRPVDGLAIAAFVVGILMLFPLSFAFAVVAIRRIARGTSRGTGFVVAALTLSGIGAAFTALLILGATLDATSPRNDVGTITKQSEISTQDLRPGDCVRLTQANSSLSTLPAMPCSDPHNAEVMMIIQAAPSPYPGEQTLVTRADAECKAQVTALLDAIPSSLSVAVYVAAQGTWDQGNRSEVCLLLHPGGDITTDMRNVK